jgi:hypothetical protein
MFVDFNILNQLGSPAINSNTFANRPAAGQTGRLFVSIDTFEIYRDNGTTWDLIGGPGSSTITGTGTATQVAYFTSSQAIGSSANLFWDNTNTRLGIGTATPGAALDIHGTGIMQQINSTSATANSLLAFQRSGTGLWRIGDVYNSGSNYFEIFNTAISTNAIAVLAATNKTEFTAVQTYTTGLARANYFDYNLSVAAAGSFSSPNAITALGASLDLTLAGSATIPSGARSGLDAYNSIAFTGAGTLTHNQGAQIRAYSNVTAGWAFNGSATGTVTHLAGLRALFPDNTGSAINVTNNYALLLNDQTPNTGTVTYTNRWGVYQEGASDLNYFAANMLLGSTVNSGERLQVNGTSYFSSIVTVSGDLNLQGAVTRNINFYDSSNTNINAQIQYDQIASNSGQLLFSTNNAGSFATRIQIKNAGSIDFNGVDSTTIYNFGQNRPNATNLRINGTNNNKLQLQNAEVDVIVLNTNGNSYLNGGNLGLGVVPGTVSQGTLFNLGANGNSLWNVDNNNITFTQNAIYNLNWLYVRTQAASFYDQNQGSHRWFVATSGTAGNVISWNAAARIESNGNFLIGTTTDAGQKLQVNGSSYLNGNTTINTSTAKGSLNINGAIGLNNGSIRTYQATGDITITISDLQPVNGNLWRQAGGVILYQGVKTDAGSPTTLYCVFTLQALSTWNSVSVSNIVGTTTLTLSGDTTTGCTLTIDVDNSCVGSAMVYLIDISSGNLS